MDHAARPSRSNPNPIAPGFRSAKAEEREGQLDAAVEALNQAISFNARASSYYYVLAGLYRRLG